MLRLDCTYEQLPEANDCCEEARYWKIVVMASNIEQRRARRRREDAGRLQTKSLPLANGKRGIQ
jgi:hypothetical protein